MNNNLKTSAEILEHKYLNRGLKIEEGIFWQSHPTQAWGEIDGLEFYFRFRWDTASIEIGENLNTNYDKRIVMFCSVKHNITGDDYAGTLTPDQEVETFSFLVDNLYEVSEEDRQEQRERAANVKDVPEPDLEEFLRLFNEKQ